jgi:iron complex transport system ATP-binding protein
MSAAAAAELLVADGVAVERSGTRVLSDFTLRAHAGELLALAGPNGAGKSSALKALAGLLPCTGSVHVQGRELRSLPLRARARAISYVPQHSALQRGLSARDVVAQGRYAHDSSWSGLQGRTDAAVERAIQVTHLRAIARRPWHELSGGEQRRVLLARALATEASIVLLDEPTAALDVGHAVRFLQLLRQLAQSGRCIVVVLHDLEQVRRYADTVLLLDAGRTVARGDARSVIAAEHIRAVYGVELEEASALGYRLAEKAP